MDNKNMELQNDFLEEMKKKMRDNNIDSTKIITEDGTLSMFGAEDNYNKNNR